MKYVPLVFWKVVSMTHAAKYIVATTVVDSYVLYFIAFRSTHVKILMVSM